MNPHHNKKSLTTSSALCLLCDSQNPCFQLSHDLRDKWSYNLCYLFNDIDLFKVKKSIENSHYCLECHTEIRKLDKIYDKIKKLRGNLQIIKSKHERKLRDLIKKSLPVPDPLIQVDLSSESSSEISGDENYDDVESTTYLDEETTTASNNVGMEIEIENNASCSFVEQPHFDSAKYSGGISLDGVAEDSSLVVPKDETDLTDEADNGENPILFVNNTNSGMSSSKAICFSEDIETVTVIVQPYDYEDQHSNPVVEDGGNQSEETVYGQLQQRYGLREFSILVERLPTEAINQTATGKGGTAERMRNTELNRKLWKLYAVKYTPSEDEKIPAISDAKRRRYMHCMCKICGKKFNWKSSLIPHLATHAELQLEQNRCSTCNRLFTGRRNFEAHEAKYKGKCIFKCDYCGYSCSEQDEIRAHKILHPPDNPFRCNIGSCDESFSSKSSLNEHKQTIHGMKSKQRGSGFNFVCEICGKSLVSEKNLRLHQTIHGGDSSVSYLGKKLNFMCDICGKYFKYKDSFQEHQSTHPELNLKQNRCTICDKLFTSSRNYESHMAKHKGVFKFKCDQCDYGCATISLLKIHSIVHTSVRPFSCDSCPEKFKSKSHLSSHVRSKHSGGAYAVDCTICGIKLSCKLGLQRHAQRVHGTEKPFSCELCGESFAIRDYLRNHLKRSHEYGKPTKGLTKKARLKMLSKNETSSEENVTSV